MAHNDPTQHPNPQDAAPTDLSQEPDEEEVMALKARYGDLQQVKTAAGYLVFRKPTRAEFQRFRSMATSGKTPEATDMIAALCVVRPSRAVFSGLLEQWPGIISACGDACALLAGITQDAEQKKL